MHIGQIVLAPVNGRQWNAAEVVGIHGDIIRVSGPDEMLIVRAASREPLGVGFPVHALRFEEKAKVS